MNTLLKETRATSALAAPIIVGQLSQMVMGVTDALMVGRLGTVPLAASAFTGGVFVFFFVTGCGLLAPVGILVAREHGRKDEAAAAEWLRGSNGVALAVSLLFAGAMAGLLPWLDRMGQPPEVVAEAGPYYALMAASIVPGLLFQVFRQFGEAMGRPRLPMAVMLGGVLLNVFLNWILIYGNLGAPRLGLAGAGWATLASRLVSLVAVAVALGNSRGLRAAWPSRLTGWPAAGRLREFLAIGIPSAAMLVFETGAFAATAFFMGWFGATALAAHQIALTCVSFSYMVPLGVSMAAGLRVSRGLAAEGRRATRAIGLGAVALSASWTLLTIPLFALGGGRLARFFSDDPAVIALAATLFVIASLFQVFDAAQVTAGGALRGLPDVRVPTLAVLTVYWVVAIPAGLALAFGAGMGPAGLWTALALALCLAAIFLTHRFGRLTRGD
ncbi:MAG: MATE family efflux transporter [Opitutaceae bacterium]|jgi:MATE family multidrug resistance protein|nr:MATE family efflux transporter [Opitutaceae bacterium]